MNSLYFILSGYMTVVLCLRDEHAAKLKKWHLQCVDDTDVDTDLVMKMKAGTWNIDNLSLMEWTLCMLNKYGIMSKEGVFKMDKALSLVPYGDQQMIEDYIDDCLPQSRSPPYQIAWEFAKCYHTKARDPLNKAKKLHYLTLFY